MAAGSPSGRGRRERRRVASLINSEAPNPTLSQWERVILSCFGKEVASQEVRTAGAPAKIVLTPDRNAIHGDGDDLSFVTARIEDNSDANHGRCNRREASKAQRGGFRLNFQASHSAVAAR